MKDFSSFHSLIELDNGRNEDAEGEHETQHERCLVASIEVDEPCVWVRHDHGKEISHSVVAPVERDAWNDAPGAAIHPTKQQAHGKSMGHLGGIAMDEGKQQGRDGYCRPAASESL